jgi:hypothetical protein
MFSFWNGDSNFFYGALTMEFSAVRGFGVRRHDCASELDHLSPHSKLDIRQSKFKLRPMGLPYKIATAISR